MTNSIDWPSIFPRRDFRHPMATRRGDARAFFAPRAAREATLSERARWLNEAPGMYAAARDKDAALFLEAIEFIDPCRPAPASSEIEGVLSAVIACGMRCETDWMVLRANACGELVLCGGAVCFPSGWALREKLGLPLSQIHERVPGLNDALRPRIDSFLHTLPAGDAFERSNWGLSANAELNHHPSRKLKRFDALTPLSESWMRLEEQLLYRLPQTNAVLFGIRVTLYPLAEVAAAMDMAERIAHALRTMPEPIAVYKGIAVARENLIRQLDGISTK